MPGFELRPSDSWPKPHLSAESTDVVYIHAQTVVQKYLIFFRTAVE